MRRDTISTTDHHLHPHMSTIPHTKIEINSFEKTIKEKKNNCVSGEGRTVV